jgi:hypothetical protein
MPNEYERIYKQYTYGDLVDIIQAFSHSCSDRGADADFACELGDKYDPIFNYHAYEEEEE